MGMNVGSDYSYVSCDVPYCRTETHKIRGENSGQNAAHDWAEKHGWHKNYTNGRWTCPNDHTENWRKFNEPTSAN